jgi:hypothetical protein
MVDTPKASDNKFLTVNPGVILTDVTEPVICALDPYFEAHRFHAKVDSCKRDPEKQLSIIKQYAIDKHVVQEFPSTINATLNGSFMFGPKIVKAWQPAWSRLLVLGVMISPPASAECLFDYEHPTKGLIKAGTIRPASEHFCDTDIHPFDIAGSAGLKTELIIVTEAKAHIAGIIDMLLEHENDALHVRCTKNGVV